MDARSFQDGSEMAGIGWGTATTGTAREAGLVGSLIMKLFLVF